MRLKTIGKHISAPLRLDLTKHNAQYKPINVKESNTFHDRFPIVDNTVYHIGTSLKDLEKNCLLFQKWK